MRRVSPIILAAVAGLGVAAAAPTAPAAAAAGQSAGTRAQGGWEPFRTKPFTTTDACSFTIRGDIVEDEEEVRTVATYPDGSPKLREFRGPLVIRFTNTANGKSVVRDVSGYAAIHYRRDGGSAWFFDGGASIKVLSGNQTTPPGSYILQGTFALEIAADGTRTIRLIHASQENLCTTLA